MASNSDLFTGTFRHDIPVLVPSGRGGLQPSLTLSYQSNAGNGWLGMGWSLPFSSIERDTQHGIDYDAGYETENYALLRKPTSAQKLVSVGNSEYRASVESHFDKIVRLSDAENRPYWKVIDKAGTQYFFGQTATARQDNPENPNQIFKWCIDRIVDGNGNEMTFSYRKEEGEIYLSEIGYGANIVRFYLEARNDIIDSYAVNFRVRTSYRLRSIDVLANSGANRLRTYQLSYKDYRGTDSGRTDKTGCSVITKVIQYDKDTNLDPTLGVILNESVITKIPLFDSHDYNDSYDSVFNQITAVGGLTGIGWLDMDFVSSSNLPDYAHITASLLTGDYNGDGKTDVLKLEPLLSNAYGATFGGDNRLFVSNGDGSFSVSTPSTDDAINLSSDWLGKGAFASAGNFNDDGKTDLFLWLPDGKNRILLSNGNGAFTSRGENPLGNVSWTAGSATIRVGDFDGDGISDIVNWSTGGAIQLFLSSNNFTQSSGNDASTSTALSIPFDISNANFITGDFDGDGKTDLILGINDQPSFTLLRSKGGGNFRVSSISLGNLAKGWTPGRANVLIADYNHDGKNDVLKIDILPLGVTIPSQSPSALFLSRGDGTFVTINTSPTDLAGNNTGFFEFKMKYSFGGAQSYWRGATNVGGDFNGDGKTDVLQLSYDTGNAGGAQSGTLFLSNGDGYFTKKSILGVSGIWNSALLPGDYIGTGKASFLKWDKSGSSSLHLWNNDQPLDTLMSFKNVFGGVTSVAYEYSTKFEDNLKLPFPVKTVKSVTRNDGNNNLSSDTFKYSLGYYHVGEREFRGFHKVQSTGPASPTGEQQITTTWFHQGNETDIIAENASNESLNTFASSAGHMKGRPYRIRVTDAGGRIYSESETIYAPDKTSTAPWFTPPSQVDTYFCDGKISTDCKSSVYKRQSRTVYGYDGGAAEYGNLTHEYHYGDITDHAYDYTVFKSFSPNLEKWMVGFPSSQLVYKGIPAGLSYLNASSTDLSALALLKKDEFYYDDLESCASTPTGNQTPVRGNLTHTVNWLKTPTVYSQKSPEVLRGYDGYGNVECTKDAKGNVTSVAYDDSTHTYPVLTTNAKQQTTKTKYYGVDGVAADNGLYGQVKSITDPNGTETKPSVVMSYDALGRKNQETLADNSWVKWTYNNLGQFIAGDVTSQHVKQESSDGLFHAVYFDGFGRTILKNKTWPGSGAFGIVTKNYYDERDLLVEESLPFRPGVEAERLNTFSYDAFGRLKAVTRPASDSRTSYTNICYDDLATLTIDPNHHIKRELKDPLGRLARVQEFLGTYTECPTAPVDPYATTVYEYDVLGNLTKVTDAKQNQTSIQYDSLGRKTEMRDPDMGRWLYDYDLNGNLTLQTDARFWKVRYGYDELNRLKTKDYDDNGADVTFTYDITPVINPNPPTEPHPIGRLTTMADGSGKTIYSYDGVGRTTHLVKTVDGKDYQLRYVYDKGRMYSITYPDNEAVIYGYNPDGNLATAGSYVTLSDFNSAGQPKTATFGDNTSTLYTYDPLTFGISTIKTSVPGRSELLLDLEYAYDLKGNIDTITDSRISSDVTFPSIGFAFPLTNESHPHAPNTSTVGHAFHYDPNGNMGSDGIRSISYNHENMPSSITLPATGVTHLVYDGDGRRVKKTNGGVSTVYVDRLFECKGNECAKYIFAGDKRVALKNSAGTFFYHNDHLGSTAAVTGGPGKEQTVTYFPFGEKLVDVGTVPVNHMYTSQELDAETGLYNYNARLYDPVMGRFISPDSLVPYPGNPQSLNRYAYCRNNPVNYIDPSGNIDFDSNGNMSFATQDAISTGGNLWNQAAASWDSGNYGSALYNAALFTLNGAINLPISFAFDMTIGNAWNAGVNYGSGFIQGDSNRLLQGSIGLLTIGVGAKLVSPSAAIVEPANSGIANPISDTLARVVPGNLKPATLGKVGDADVFVTNAADIRGLSASQIAQKLTIPPSSSFRVFEFPSLSVNGIASPINRVYPGFVGGGRTAGGAAEFVIPNGPIPAGAVERIVK